MLLNTFLNGQLECLHIDFFSGTNILQEVKVPVVGNNECKCKLKNVYVSDDMMCAGLRAGGKDACQVREDLSNGSSRRMMNFAPDSGNCQKQ